ncbi:MAG: hypothetical protein QNJ32_08525 [Xenococcaceae cyanobacterium MO_167.B27]|nr:hypothetical protein [Xenococcaceae cyanobacterium MO_167.B27]
MKIKSLVSLGAVSVGVVSILTSAGVAQAAQLAPGILQFDSAGGGAFFGNNVIDFSNAGTPSEPSPGDDATIAISAVPFTDGAFSFLAGTTAEIQDLQAVPFLIEDNVTYDFVALTGSPVTGFLNDFAAAPGLQFDLERLRRTSDNTGRVQFNLAGLFTGGGFDDTPVDFQFSLITAQLPPSTNLNDIAFFDPLVVGANPDVTTAEGLNNPTVSGGVIVGDACGGATGVTCNTGFTSYSGQFVTVTGVPEPSSTIGGVIALGLGALATRKKLKR